MARPQAFVSLILISAAVFFHNFHLSNAEIDPSILQEIRDPLSIVDVLVQFNGGNSQVIKDIESTSFPSHEEKVKALVSGLEALASKTQDPITDALKKVNVTTSQSFWISNQMVIRNVSSYVLKIVQSFPQVSKIGKLHVYEASSPIEDSERVKATKDDGTAWGVEKIEANNVFVNDNSITGQNVIVANIDSGVRGTHEALEGNFLEDGWFDPIRDSLLPNDQDGHGTHTMGIMVGAVGSIGVAPGAQWMACKGCTKDNCDNGLLLDCAQWFIKDAPKIPDIINNSWNGPPIAAVPDDSFDGAVAAWVAADILPVFANGNQGRTGCATVGYPAHLATVFGVGATAQNDTLADFSSRGPGLDGVEPIKPDISAPGDQILSSWVDSDTSYATKSGTSMAAPHFTGVLALMLSAKREAAGDSTVRFRFADIKAELANMVDNSNLNLPAAPCSPTDTPDGYVYPNNDYGYGLVNALKAADVAINSLSTI